MFEQKSSVSIGRRNKLANHNRHFKESKWQTKKDLDSSIFRFSAKIGRHFVRSLKQKLRKTKKQVRIGTKSPSPR